jgi:DNA-binding NarL/FixJ family response regulator
MVMSKSTASKLPASSARSPKAARQRRLQAARLFEQGLSHAEVARRLGVSRQTASCGMRMTLVTERIVAAPATR